MQFRIITIFMVSLLLGGNAFAQRSPSAESKYKAGVSDYNNKRYAAALEKLSPLTIANPDPVYSRLAPFSHYYYSLSAYQLKRYREGRQMLMQLVSRYPGWTKINDAYYLLAANSFALGQTKEALDYLQKIKDSSLSKDVASLKQYHLSTLNNLPKLKEFQKAYPNDRDIAVVLVQTLETTKGTSKADLQYAAQLEKQFKITREDKETQPATIAKNTIPKSENRWTKGFWDVSVLLPFRLEEFTTSSKRRTNQFAYDYYLGLTLAKEKLKSEGINVNLWAYDISNDPKPMQEIASNAAFRKSDLVIGPLYTNSFDVAIDAVGESEVVMVNPLSTDSNLLKASSNIYLAHPGIGYQIQKGAQWMRTVAPGQSIAVYYGGNAKDSIMAFTYAEEWKSKGGKILEMLKIRPDREWLEGKVSTFETTKPSHIALFSTDAGLGPNLVEVMNGRKLNSVSMLATSTSFNMQQSSVKSYASRLYLLETDYVDRDKEAIREFQKSYWNVTNTFPSVYSYQGYDQLLFFGRMLNKYKDRLKDGIKYSKHVDEDYLLSGFDYTKSNENMVSPVLRSMGRKWVPAY